MEKLQRNLEMGIEICKTTAVNAAEFNFEVTHLAKGKRLALTAAGFISFQNKNKSSLRKGLAREKNASTIFLIHFLSIYYRKILLVLPIL